MKKSLIALAVLGAFAGTAAAKSSATLYGLIDVGYGVSNAGAYEGASGLNGKFQQWGNSNSTSRWGLKGSEDLGNGTSVVFNLEQGFNPETGKQNDGFNRAAWVGLSGNFGTVIAGRMTTVMNNVLGKYDLSGAPNLTSSLGNAGISAISQRWAGNNYSRINSALAYVSPDFAGFSFQAAVALKNDNILGLDNSAQGFNKPTVNAKYDPMAHIEAKNLYTVGAQYKIGGFSVAAAYESKPVSARALDISASWGIAAKYDFNSFVISAGYLDNHLRDDGRGFWVGAMVPFNNFEFGAQVAYNTKAYNGEQEARFGFVPNASLTGFEPAVVWQDKKLKPLAWELWAKYKLSNRSTLYAQYGGIDSDAEKFQGAERKYSASFGLIHKF